MPVMKDYKCANETCSHLFEHMAAIDEMVKCPKCGCDALPTPVGTKSYKIKGPNDASVTPKKHRGAE